MTSQWSTRTGSQTGSGGLRVGPVWVGPDTWQAVALPRHGRGPLLGFVHSSRAWAWLTVDQEVLVHGPQTGLRWTQSTLHLLRCGLREPSARACVAGEDESSVSPAVVLLPTASSRVSLRGGASAQLVRVEAPPSLGVFIGGVDMACGVPWCGGHGGGLPSTMAASVRWLWPRRGISVLCVSFTRFLRAQRCSSTALVASGDG